MDINPPNIGNLIIDGELIFDSTLPISDLNVKNIWVRRGNITAGTKDNNFYKKIFINLKS